MKNFAKWFASDPWTNMGYIVAGIILVLLVGHWISG
jgi:hypothetical protein